MMRHLRLLALALLQVSRHQQAEKLLGPAQLDVGFDLDGIPALHQRIEAFVKINGFLGGDAVGEIFACGDLTQGHLAGELENLQEAPPREPVAVVVDLSLVEIDQTPDLVEIIAGVGRDLVFGQLGAGLIAAGGIADQRGVVADDDHGGVAQVLELAELAQGDSVPEVHIDAGGVDTVLDAHGAFLADGSLEFLDEFGFGHDCLDTTLQNRELFGNRPHRNDRSPLRANDDRTTGIQSEVILRANYAK